VSRLLFLVVDYKDINPCLLLPPYPPPSRIMGLRGSSRQNLERQGLIFKIFRNKDLAQNPRLFYACWDFGGGLTPVHLLTLCLSKSH
jgi:hypothetical protein